MTLYTGLLEAGIALPLVYHCWFLGFFPLCLRHLTTPGSAARAGGELYKKHRCCTSRRRLKVSPALCPLQPLVRQIKKIPWSSHMTS
jgi:hypothetical protein